MNFGTKLRELRHAKGMTLQEVADKARIQPTHLSGMELGRLLPPKDFVWRRISQALGLCDADYISMSLVGASERSIDGDCGWDRSAFHLVYLFGQALSYCRQSVNAQGDMSATLKRFIKRHS